MAIERRKAEILEFKMTPMPGIFHCDDGRVSDILGPDSISPLADGQEHFRVQWVSRDRVHWSTVTLIQRRNFVRGCFSFSKIASLELERRCGWGHLLCELGKLYYCWQDALGNF